MTPALEDDRPPILLGVSLKLYLDIVGTKAWAREVAKAVGSRDALRNGQVRLFVLPSLPALEAVRQELAGTPVEFGAQDLHWEDRGAFTGAVSGVDLRDLGCGFVEVGHAERKRIFGEGGPTIARKLEAAFRNRLTPVLCVGEATETDAEIAAEECIDQLAEALAGAHSVDTRSEIVVAYEPEWAIGQAQPAATAHVRVVAQRLREWLDANFSGGRSSVIYGGSAQCGTLSDLRGSVDGLFLGRFAHRVADFTGIVDEASNPVGSRGDDSRRGRDCGRDSSG